MADIFLESHNVVELDGLKDSVTDAYVSGATVNLFMGVAANGKGLLGPLSMAFVSGSNGKYRVTLTDAQIASLVDQTDYVIRIEVDNSGVKALFLKGVRAKIRTI